MLMKLAVSSGPASPTATIAAPGPPRVSTSINGGARLADSASGEREEPAREGSRAGAWTSTHWINKVMVVHLSTPFRHPIGLGVIDRVFHVSLKLPDTHIPISAKQIKTSTFGDRSTVARGRPRVSVWVIPQGRGVRLGRLRHGHSWFFNNSPHSKGRTLFP